MRTLEKIVAVKGVRPSLTLFGLLAFVCGFAAPYGINLVGELFVAEIALPLLALIVLGTRGEAGLFSNRQFMALVGLGLLMLLGYVASDLFAGTPQEKYLRGWARVLVVISDYVSLSIIAQTDRRNLWWFMLGVALGTLVLLIKTGMPLSDWKLGYGPATALLLACLSSFLPMRLAALLFGVFGVYGIGVDSRVSGAIGLVVGGILWARGGGNAVIKARGAGYLKLTIAAVVALIVVVTVTMLTEDEYADRREKSNLGRFAAIEIGLRAILDSPILGHGSWGEGTQEYADELYKEVGRELEKEGIYFAHGKTLMAHSQIIQAWMEGGLLAALFFVYYGYRIVLSLRYTVTTAKADFLMPAYLLVLCTSLWHAMMSPFNGQHRMDIALAIAVAILVSEEMRRASESDRITDTATDDAETPAHRSVSTGILRKARSVAPVLAKRRHPL